MPRAFDVVLAGCLVGTLTDEDGGVTFRFARDYRNRPIRPVLGQFFEDDLERSYHGSKRRLPPFFENLVPEGPLRQIIERTLNLPTGDDLALLSAAGGDLPGAVELRSSESAEVLFDPNDAEAPEEETEETAEQLGLRFSLAGVQLKFSVLRQDERLTLPGKGEYGQWIVKIDSARFPEVVRNEFATMSWARASGFDVPECFIGDARMLSPGLQAELHDNYEILCVRRYDRAGQEKVHQEDLAQATGTYSVNKYTLTYEQLGAVFRGVLGDAGYFEFIRRLVFVVCSGNGDAHLKNWSLIYRDGITPSLAPLYDQVNTTQWPDISYELALKLGPSKRFQTVDLAALVKVAKRAGADVQLTTEVAIETVRRILASLESEVVRSTMSPAYIQAIDTHLKKVPLVRSI